MKKEHVSLWRFKESIEHSWDNRGLATGMRVMFMVNGIEYKLDSITQGTVIPDIVVRLVRMNGKK